MHYTAAALPLVLLGCFVWSEPSSTAPAVPTTSATPHCQVPCGVYGDQMRIQMLMEDATTIEKGMTSIQELEKQVSGNANQLVRWVMTKDEHAQKIQDTVAAYWLTQRIKAPKEAAGREKYVQQLELMHGLTVAAMKCKQTTDVAHVAKLRELGGAFSETYFSAEDLEHLEGHHK